MNEQCQKINLLLGMLNAGQDTSALFPMAKEAALTMLEILSETPPFSYMDIPKHRERIERVFTADNALKYVEFAIKAVTNSLPFEEVPKYADAVMLQRYTAVFGHLAYSLGEYQTAMLDFAEKSDGNEADRTAEGFARMFGNYFSPEFSITEGNAWMSTLNNSVQYVSVIRPGEDVAKLVKRMHYVSFVGMFRALSNVAYAKGDYEKEMGQATLKKEANYGRNEEYVMAQKYDLTDIGNALSRVMDNPMTKIIRSGSIGVLGVVNPVAGIVGGIGNDLLSEYNTFKLGHLLNGLASGFNLERRLNELYNYVNSSPEKAIIVANLFKQTVNAECPKVCVIYGLILANHLETLTEFTHEELIVCKALENATDYDLKNFKEIMENYLKTTSNGRRIVFPKDFADIAAFTTTCDWCVYNRIFVSRTAEWGEMEEGVLDMSTYYYEANPAAVLLDNINAARQTWNYG